MARQKFNPLASNGRGDWDLVEDLSGYVLTSRTLELVGTTNQVTVSPTGSQDLSANRSWTLSLPQDVHTAASPVFSQLTLNSLTTEGTPASIVSVNGAGLLQETSIGDLSTTIEHNNLSNLNWSVAAHTIDTALLPDGDQTRDLGASGTRWKDGYLSSLTVDGTTKGLVAEITGFNAVNAGRFIIDSTDNSTVGAIYASNDTNFAHSGFIGKFEAKNATDTGSILSLVNAGTGDYITADSVFSVTKAGLTTTQTLLTATSGSASSPSIRLNDTNTGLYLSATDTIGATAGGYAFMQADVNKRIGWFNNAPNPSSYNYASVTNTADIQTIYYNVDYTFNNGNSESNVTVLDFIARNETSSAAVALETAVVKAENKTTALTEWTAIVGDPRLAGNISGAFSPTMRGFSFRPFNYSDTWSSASGTVTMEAFYVPARPTGYTPGTVTFNYYGYRALEGLFVHNDNGGDYDARFEGDTDTNLLFIDASTDRIGVGNATPAVKLDVTGEVRASTAGTNTTSVVTVGGTQTLTNKTLTAPRFADLGFIADANGNELIVMDTVGSAVPYIRVANNTTGNNPSIEADGETNVGLTLKGKGTKGVTVANALIKTVVTLTDGATPALNASLGNVFVLVAAGNRTIAVPTNPTSGQEILIRHDASGADRTLALNTGAGGFRFGTDITGLTATTSGKSDWIKAAYDATDSRWDVIGYVKGY